MTDLEDLKLDLAWKWYNNIFECHKNLNFKASVILAANGIMLGFIPIIFRELPSLKILFLAIFPMLSILLCVIIIAGFEDTFTINFGKLDHIHLYPDNIKSMKIEIYDNLCQEGTRNHNELKRKL